MKKSWSNLISKHIIENQNSLFYYRDNLWTCWIAKRPMLYNAHDAATNNGRAITNIRVSINKNPLYIIFKIYKIIPYYYTIIF